MWAIKMSLLSLFLLLFISCNSMNQDDLVLKKSENPTPQWINENGKLNTNDPKFVNIIFQKSDLYNLSLGVKQSESIALKKYSYLVLSEVQHQILNKMKNLYPNLNKTDYDVISMGVSKAVNKCLQGMNLTTPLADKVYWEYRQHESSRNYQQYFVVWVLLLVPKSDYDKAILAVANELKNSKEETVATLGENILQ